MDLKPSSNNLNLPDLASYQAYKNATNGDYSDILTEDMLRFLALCNVPQDSLDLSRITPTNWRIGHVCLGQCHGFTGGTGRDLTSEETQNLELAAQIIEFIGTGGIGATKSLLTGGVKLIGAGGVRLLAGKLTIKGLGSLPRSLANPALIRESIVDYIKASQRNRFSLATASVEANGETHYFISVSGKSWKGTSPNTINIDGNVYTVIRGDSGAISPVSANANHAEQKLFSYIQDTYSGKTATVKIAVQNTSLSNPGMCSGCGTTVGTFNANNPNFTVEIFHGTSGINP